MWRARHAPRWNARSSTPPQPPRNPPSHALRQQRCRAPRPQARSNEEEAMKAPAPGLVASLVAGVGMIVTAFAQAPPKDSSEAQQEAHRHWREADPKLEGDAISAG